jgi:hypothetical protein
MTMEEWIKTLKAGDEVAVMLQHDPPVIRAVERVTPSGRILVRTFRALDTFNPDGRERSAGRSYYRKRIEPVTPELRDRAERAVLTRRIDRVAWHLVPLATLRAVVAALDAEVTK